MSVTHQANSSEIIDDLIKKFDELQIQATGSVPVVIEFMELLLLDFQAVRDSSPGIAVEINIHLAAYSNELGKIRIEFNGHNINNALEIWRRASQDLRYKLEQIKRNLKAEGSQGAPEGVSIAGRSLSFASIIQPISEEKLKSLQTSGSNLKAGPGGLYVIKEIPSDWKVEQVSMPELMNFLTTKYIDKKLIEKAFGKIQEKNILLVRSIEEVSYSPIHGKSSFNGIIIPMFISDSISTQLIIIPIERSSPPLYIKKNLLQSFFQITGGLITNAILNDMSAGKLDNGTRYLYAQCSNKLENFVANGDVRSFAINVKAFAFEGLFKDFILLLRYPSFAEANEKVQKQHDQLMEVISSFSPIGTYDEEEINRIKNSMENLILDQIRKSEIPSFLNSLYWEVGRTKGVDLDNINNLNKIVSSFEAFSKLASNLDYSDETLLDLWDEENWKEFWNSIAEAKKGNPTEFKEFLVELMEEFGIDQTEAATEDGR